MLFSQLKHLWWVNYVCITNLKLYKLFQINIIINYIIKIIYNVIFNVFQLVLKFKSIIILNKSTLRFLHYLKIHFLWNFFQLKIYYLKKISWWNYFTNTKNFYLTLKFLQGWFVFTTASLSIVYITIEVLISLYLT